MALPTFDAARHHIGLKERGGATLFGFMLEGGYSKEIQREAIGAPDLGGATDLIGQTPSLSRWTQDAFEGGMYAYEWGRDDAMFADCTGFIPMPHSRSLQSCPPMYMKAAIDSDARTGFASDVPKSMFMVAGSIYIVWAHTMVRYQIDSGTTTWLDVVIDSDYRWVGAEYNSADQIIWAAAYDTTKVGLPRIDRIKTDLSGSAGFDPWYTGPTGTARNRCFGFSMFHDKVVMQLGRKLWVGDPPDDPDPTADNDVVAWTKIGWLPGRWWDSVPQNELLYILVNDGSFKSSVYAFDGEFVMPICTFPFNFYAKCITEYAGRIFVGGLGTDVNGGEHYAELYEITGSSVRLVRSFSPETRNQFLGGLAGEWPRQIDDMTVFEGMLWFGQKGKRMVAYDITSDGFFGASEIQSETDLNMAKVISGRGRIWAYAVDDDEDANHGIYRIAQPADTVAAWQPTFITSDFIYEPGMDKRWSEICVMTRFGAVENIDYSVDSGETWVALTVASVNANKVFRATAPLVAIAPSRLIRFRFRLDSDSASDAKTYHRELVAFTVSFAMLDSGKKAWGIGINGAIEIETRDAEVLETATQVYDVSEVRSQLWAWADAKTPLTYRDLNDVEYDVSIVGFRESTPLVAPDPTGESQPEAHYALTLLEI